MDNDNKALLLRSLNAAAAYRDETLFIRYLERLVIFDGTQDTIAVSLGVEPSTLFRRFRENDLSWCEIEDILQESGYKLLIKGMKK